MSTSLQKTKTEIMEIPQSEEPIQAFASMSSFEIAQRMATALSNSDLVPQMYRGKMPNCLVALELAQRCKASVLMVMQNLYVIQGKPSWSSQYIIAALNSCGKFSPLRFKLDGLDSCTAYAIEHETGETLYGPPVTMAMAKAEGWVDKSGSKWKTMPELMLRYRAAAFFGRLYAPEVLMGLSSREEADDSIETTGKVVSSAKAADLSERLKLEIPEGMGAPEEGSTVSFDNFEIDPKMVK